MNSQPRKFDLYQGDVCLGVITLSPSECDFPWFVGYLEPSAEYASVKPLFDREAELSHIANDADEFDEQAQNDADALMDEIAELGIRVKSHHSDEWDDVLGLSITGNRVGWR